MVTIMKKVIKALTGFAILFLLYHAAEYMIVFQNSVEGFLMGQGLFFAVAYQLARCQSRKGLSAWGLGFSANTFRLFLSGTMMGIALYGSSWLLNLAFGFEIVQKVPASSVLIQKGGLFTFGVFFSSLSEDILTRGYVYYHLQEKVSSVVLGVISAIIYLLNHIYKLGSGPEAWLYLFPLGLLYVMPLIMTGNLWFAGAMHWVGNVFFYMSHDLIDTQSGSSISPNYIFCGYILFIQVSFVVLRNCTKAVINGST